MKPPAPQTSAVLVILCKLSSVIEFALISRRPFSQENWNSWRAHVVDTLIGTTAVRSSKAQSVTNEASRM